MQLSSTELNQPLDELSRCVDAVASIDVACLSGSDAALLLRRLTPIKRRLDAVVSACGARAVGANQHNLAGAKSGSSWLANQLGESEKTARRALALEKQLASNPDVASKVRSGELSPEKGEVIASAADGDAEVTRDLLNMADSESVESLRQRASRASSSGESAEHRRRRLRRSQYIYVNRDKDNMLLGQFKLSPENASWLPRWTKLEHEATLDNEKAEAPLPAGAARAEAFSKMIGEVGGTTKSTVAFHVDLDRWQETWPTTGPMCELVGVGPVPISVLDDVGDHVGLRLLLKSKNKLVWYSEGKAKNAQHLPDFIKRAVKANAYDQCETDKCTDVATQVDHGLAETNGGGHDLDNLYAICEPDHHAKTKQDAPWTTGGIYGRTKTEWQRLKERNRSAGDDAIRQSPDERAPDTLFPDTG